MEMMSRLNKHILIAAATLSVITVNAREKAGSVFRTSATQKVMAGCSPAQNAAELTVNNVRTIIYSGSDMWWDLFGTGNAWYAIPKVEDKSKFQNSCFAGNVWFGGLDVGGQLKIAAQTYRQGGIDFWSGPLSTVDASITQDVCSKYDKIFTMSRENVDNYILAGGEMTSDIANWPGNGDLSLNQDPQLAPYFDGNGNGVYDPENRMDYPYYDIYNNAGFDNLGVCKARVFGDQTLWWVYNDNGGVHQATGGKAIGMEVRAQAFAFKTTDEINNMTFYNYQIINRSSFSLLNTYMTVWTDADLGQYADDYIGCDVKRGLGYIYNGDSNDETAFGVNGYGAYIPALGCDFFQGPINTTDNVDNDSDGQIDEPGEQMGMTKFLFFNNSLPGFPTQTTDPQTAAQYYQYMTGFWRDGTPFTCGGNAYGGSVPTSYVYPSDTYTAGACGSATWDDTGVPGDRRFMQSSGPFTLAPGAVNYVTFGLPWARTTAANSPKSSIPLLKIADDKAQALFDNCFKVLSGPEAPDMTIQEMNNELILYFSNKPGSNNYLNQYLEKDVAIIVDTTHYYPVDKFYHMEGFKVYQLKNEFVLQEQLHDQSKAKLVFSCDINNGVQRLINYEYDAATGGDVAIDKTEGQVEFDKGLKSTFHFTQDQFSLSSDKKVVNNKPYYFFCVAYGYNQYGQYKEDAPFTALNVASSEGQKRPYLEGRKSKKAYGIPHIADPEKDGSVTNSVYGYGPKVTRLEGQGNGGNILDLTQESIDKILANGGRENVITYENGRGPINIKVVDPLNVPNSTFSFKFVDRNWFYKSGLTNAQMLDTMNLDQCKNASTWHKSFPYPLLTKRNTQYGKINADTATWVLTDLSTNKEYVPCKAIKIAEEYYFSDLGLSLNIGQSRDVGEVNVPSTMDDKVIEQADLLEGTISFADPSSPWLAGIPDTDGESPFNWIRSGSFKDEPANPSQNDYIVSAATSGTVFADPNGVFEGVLNGTWAPYLLTASTKTNVLAAPGYSASASASGLVSNAYDLRGLASVDIVLTKDKSKWTHCLVLEECDENVANPTGAKKLEARRSRCVDKQGIPLGSPGCNTAEALVDSLPNGVAPGTYQFQYGLGWFPGYAINLETGERLNIAFGEDSYQSNSNPGSANNGGDMIWNPTASGADFTSGYPYTFGGRHYIYVFGHNRSSMTYSITSGVNQGLTNKPVGVGTYSQFADFAYSYKLLFANNNNNMLSNIWTEAMWVNIPLLSDSRYAFTNPADMPCDAKVRLRVKKGYRYGMSGVYTNTLSAFRAGTLGSPIYEGTVGTPTYYSRMTTDTLPVSVNNNFGYYTFNTSDIFTEIANADKLKSGLDLINVVPNPYYAYSTYESNRTDTRVRITNLPNKCKIKIFTLNGTLVRTFDRDVSGQEDEVQVSSSDFKYSRRLPYQDWDLKNQNGITVASGLYIIHIDVPGVGEKILKWFGVMRPLDLQNY